jgi:hypothetical protein
MPYLIMSRPSTGENPIFRRAAHVIEAYDAGYAAITASERGLRFLPSDRTEPEISEADIRESIANREHYRREYARMGMRDPYWGAPL